MSDESRSTRYVVSINQILAHRGYFDTLKKCSSKSAFKQWFLCEKFGYSRRPRYLHSNAMNCRILAWKSKCFCFKQPVCIRIQFFFSFAVTFSVKSDLQNKKILIHKFTS